LIDRFRRRIWLFQHQGEADLFPGEGGELWANLKELIAGEEDFLRPLIGLVVQEVLEAEMSGMPTPNRCIWVTT
jgi:hypothetical protein